jgi:hypothetical protein
MLDKNKKNLAFFKENLEILVHLVKNSMQHI